MSHAFILKKHCSLDFGITIQPFFSHVMTFILFQCIGTIVHETMARESLFPVCAIINYKTFTYAINKEKLR